MRVEITKEIFIILPPPSITHTSIHSQHLLHNDPLRFVLKFPCGLRLVAKGVHTLVNHFEHLPFVCLSTFVPNAKQKSHCFEAKTKNFLEPRLKLSLISLLVSLAFQPSAQAAAAHTYNDKTYSKEVLAAVKATTGYAEEDHLFNYSGTTEITITRPTSIKNGNYSNNVQVQNGLLVVQRLTTADYTGLIARINAGTSLLVRSGSSGSGKYNGEGSYGLLIYNNSKGKGYAELDLSGEGKIASLGIQTNPLGSGIGIYNGPAASIKAPTFQSVSVRIDDIQARQFGIYGLQLGASTLEPAGASQFVHGFIQKVENLGSIHINSNDYYNGAVGIYSKYVRAPEFPLALADLEMAGEGLAEPQQYVELDGGIYISGGFNSAQRKTDIDVTGAIGILNFGSNNQTIVAKGKGPNDKGIEIDISNIKDKSAVYTSQTYPKYSVLVMGGNLAEGGISEYANTITTLKGSFHIKNGDVAVMRGFDIQKSKMANDLLAEKGYGLAFSSNDDNRTLTLEENVNLWVTRQTPLNTVPASVSLKYFLSLGENEEIPYKVVLGRKSFINVQGTYRGNSTLEFASDFRAGEKGIADSWLDRDEFMADLKEKSEAGRKEINFGKELDKQEQVLSPAFTDKEMEARYKEAYEKSNRIIVNKNAVLLDTISKQSGGQASRINLEINMDDALTQMKVSSNDENIMEAPEFRKYINQNAIYIMREAANNVFVKNWNNDEEKDNEKVTYLPDDLTKNLKTSNEDNITVVNQQNGKFLEYLDNDHLISDAQKEVEKNNLHEQRTENGRTYDVSIEGSVKGTYNRFTGSEVKNRRVLGRVSFTIPEGLVTPGRTYHTEYYLEQSDKYTKDNPYQYNDNGIVNELLANIQDGELKKLSTKTSTSKIVALEGEEEVAETSKGSLVEDTGYHNMAEVNEGVVETEIKAKAEDITPPPEDDCTKYGNCAPDPVEPTPDDPKPVNPNPWDEVTPPTKPDGSIDIGNGCSTSTMDALDSIGLTNYFLWRQENETLYQRLGEVRDNPELEGLWFRGIVGKNKWDKGKRHFENKYYGIQIGLDRVHQTFTDEYKCREVDGEGAPCRRVPATDWIYGFGLTYMKGQSKLANGGSGDNWIGTLSFYGTRKFQNGGYLDLIVKGSRLNNEFTAISDQFRYLSKGKYHTYAFQASVEYGNKHYLNKDKTWYVDPEVQLTYGHIKGVKYRTFNSLNVNVHNLNSLIGRAGIGIGKEGKKGSAFVKVDALREFKGEYKARYHLDNGAWNKSRVSMKDTWGEVTIGGTYNFRKDTYGFVQAKKSFASDLKQEYRVDAGIRYVF